MQNLNYPPYFQSPNVVQNKQDNANQLSSGTSFNNSIQGVTNTDVESGGYRVPSYSLSFPYQYDEVRPPSPAILHGFSQYHQDYHVRPYIDNINRHSAIENGTLTTESNILPSQMAAYSRRRRARLDDGSISTFPPEDIDADSYSKYNNQEFGATSAALSSAQIRPASRYIQTSTTTTRGYSDNTPIVPISTVRQSSQYQQLPTGLDYPVHMTSGDEAALEQLFDLDRYGAITDADNFSDMMAGPSSRPVHGQVVHSITTTQQYTDTNSSDENLGSTSQEFGSVDFGNVWRKSTSVPRESGITCMDCHVNRNCNRDPHRCPKCWEKNARQFAEPPVYFSDSRVPDLKTAIRVLRPRLAPLGIPDDDVAEEKKYADAYVANMLEAISTPYTGAEANKRNAFLLNQQETLNGNAAVEEVFYNNSDVTAHLRCLFEFAVQLHEGTDEMIYQFSGDCKGYTIQRCRFSTRMECIRVCLRDNKRVAVDMIELRAPVALVVNPDQVNQRKLANSSSNRRKSERMKRGKQASLESQMDDLYEGDEAQSEGDSRQGGSDAGPSAALVTRKWARNKQRRRDKGKGRAR